MEAGGGNDSAGPVLDLSHLQENERAIILSVLRRDEELRNEVEAKVRATAERVKESGAKIASRRSVRVKGRPGTRQRECGVCGAGEGGASTSKLQNCCQCKTLVCAGCREVLGKKTAGNCLCVGCASAKKMRFLSGEWLFGSSPSAEQKKQDTFGSGLIRKSIYRTKPKKPRKDYEPSLWSPAEYSMGEIPKPSEEALPEGGEPSKRTAPAVQVQQAEHTDPPINGEFPKQLEPAKQSEPSAEVERPNHGGEEEQPASAPIPPEFHSERCNAESHSERCNAESHSERCNAESHSERCNAESHSERCNAAAVTMQSCWRAVRLGREQRAQYMKTRSAARLIQQWCRVRQCRRDFLRRR
eukprot:scpid73925/ scgid3235/ Synaptotagmin-like protein 4; Exophilin-2; Granuphilin